MLEEIIQALEMKAEEHMSGEDLEIARVMVGDIKRKLKESEIPAAEEMKDMEEIKERAKQAAAPEMVSMVLLKHQPQKIMMLLGIRFLVDTKKIGALEAALLTSMVIDQFDNSKDMDPDLINTIMSAGLDFALYCAFPPEKVEMIQKYIMEIVTGAKQTGDSIH